MLCLHSTSFESFSRLGGPAGSLHGYLATPVFFVFVFQTFLRNRILYAPQLPVLIDGECRTVRLILAYPYLLF